MNSFLIVWLVSLVAKLLLGVFLPFATDEAYYWVWGQNPQLSYYDHPPMIGWLFWLGAKLEFFAQSSRIPGIILGHSSWLIWYKILRPHLDDVRLQWWLILVTLSPLVGLGSLIMTPDVPLIFFWSLSMLCLVRAIQSRHAIWYAALGLALGLGFCSKYQIVLFVPAALLWVGFSHRLRAVRWSLIPLTIVCGLIACAPVLIWNYSHDFASFAFQLRHGFEAQQRNWHWPLDYVSAQFFLVFPTVLIASLRKNRTPFEIMLSWFAWFPFAFFFYSSFNARPEANWTMVGYPSLMALAVLKAPSLRGLKATALLWAIAIAVAASHAFVPWIPVEPRKLKTYEFVKFDPLLEPAKKFAPFYSGSYQMAASLSYKLRTPILKLGGLNRRDFFDFLERSYPDGDRFYVALERFQTLPEWILKKGYSGTEILNLNNGEFRVLEVTRVAPSPNR